MCNARSKPVMYYKLLTFKLQAVCHVDCLWLACGLPLSSTDIEEIEIWKTEKIK